MARRKTARVGAATVTDWLATADWSAVYKAHALGTGRRTGQASIDATGSGADDLVEGASPAARCRRGSSRRSASFLTRARPERLRLAVAAPIDEDTPRSVELALRRPIALAVATADDFDAALSLRLEPDQPSDAPQVGTGTGRARMISTICATSRVVRRWCGRSDDLLRLAVEQRATDLHIEPAGKCACRFGCASMGC